MHEARRNPKRNWPNRGRIKEPCAKKPTAPTPVSEMKQTRRWLLAPLEPWTHQCWARVLYRHSISSSHCGLGHIHPTWRYAVGNKIKVCVECLARMRQKESYQDVCVECVARMRQGGTLSEWPSLEGLVSIPGNLPAEWLDLQHIRVSSDFTVHGSATSANTMQTHSVNNAK